MPRFKLPLTSCQNICLYVSRTIEVRTIMKLCVVFMLLNFLQTTDCIRTSIFRASMKVFMVIYFLRTSFGEISSEGELFVHRGKAVMLFTNITVDNYEKEDQVVSLYINGDNNERLVAVWILESNIAIKWLDDYYARKIFMDANQNIWICDVEDNDVGLYAIKYGKLNNLAGPEVKLTVLDELSEEEQVQKWLDDHPEIKKKYSSSSILEELAGVVVVFIVTLILNMTKRECKNDQMLDEITRNFSETKVKNILLVGSPSVGKSSLINSLASLILGKYIPVASVGQGYQFTHTLASRRYPHFGITEEHLRGSPNEENARRIHPHLPYLTDFTVLAEENTEEMREILLLQILGYLRPGINIPDLLEHKKKHGVGYLREDWKTDIVIFVHSAPKMVPKQLIQCLLNVIRLRNTLYSDDVDVYVVLTKMDEVESGNVSRITVDRIEDDIADLFGFHGCKEYRLFKLTNWCDDVGFPNSTANNLDGSDKLSVTLNYQLLNLLCSMSTPRARMLW